VIPENPQAAKGAAPRTQTQPVISVPNKGFSQKYSPTAVPTASTEHKNCRAERPKKMASW